MFPNLFASIVQMKFCGRTKKKQQQKMATTFNVTKNQMAICDVGQIFNSTE